MRHPSPEKFDVYFQDKKIRLRVSKTMFEGLIDILKEADTARKGIKRFNCKSSFLILCVIILLHNEKLVTSTYFSVCTRVSTFYKVTFKETSLIQQPLPTFNQFRRMTRCCKFY